MHSRLLAFGLASLAGLVVMVLVMIFFFRLVAERDLRMQLDMKNESLARLVGSSLEQSGLDEALELAAETRGSALSEHPAVERFEQTMPRLESDTFTSVSALYDRGGTVVYSTDTDLIGDDGSENPRVREALQGRRSSALLRRTDFNQIGVHGIEANRDVYQSYIPLFGVNGSIRGVLEIRTDATKVLLARTRIHDSVVTGVVAIAALFYAVLFAIYYQTHLAMEENAEQREKALAALSAAKEELEERVEERTRELAKSERFLQTVIDGVGDPILVIDRDYSVTALNDAAREMVAKRDLNPTGLPCYELSHRLASPCSTDDGNLCPLHEAIESGAPSRVVHKHDRDGVERVVQITATPFRNEEGVITGIVEVEHDITELVTTSQKLSHSEQRFRDVSEAAGEYIWELDRHSRFTFVSDRVRDVLGYEPAELIGRTPADFMPAEERERVRRHFHSHGEGRPFYNLVHCSIAKDGQRVWQSVSSVPIYGDDTAILGARGVCQDITLEMRANEALQRSESHLRSVMDNVVDAILTFDEAGVVQSANRAAGRMFAARADELLGGSFLDLVLLPEASGDGVAWSDSIAALEGQRECEGLRRDGSRLPIDLWVGRMDAGDESLFLALVHDDTEKKKAQRELEQARLQYYHQEKMAAIGQLAAGILHEVGNPIAAISGSIDEIRSMQQEAAADATHSIEALWHVDMIGKQIERLGRVTREIASFAAPRAHEQELLDLNELVEATTRLLRYDRRLRSIELKENFDRSLPAIMGVADRLTQVVMNVLLNAIDAAEQVPDGSATIEVLTASSGDRALLVVRDNGAGMDDQVVARCLDAFYTTKPPGKGTGLGLSICDAIVSDHGGSIWIESTPGAGTTVHIALPLPDPRS